MQVRENKLYEFIVNCFVYYTGNVNSSVQYVKWETDARTATWCKQRVYILVSFPCLLKSFELFLLLSLTFRASPFVCWVVVFLMLIINCIRSLLCTDICFSSSKLWSAIVIELLIVDRRHFSYYGVIHKGRLHWGGSSRMRTEADKGEGWFQWKRTSEASAAHSTRITQ